MDDYSNHKQVQSMHDILVIWDLCYAHRMILESLGGKHCKSVERDECAKSFLCQKQCLRADLPTFLLILWEVEVTYVGVLKLLTFSVYPLSIAETCAHNIGVRLTWKIIIIYGEHSANLSVIKMVCIHCAGKRGYGLFMLIVCRHLSFE